MAIAPYDKTYNPWVNYMNSLAKPIKRKRKKQMNKDVENTNPEDIITIKENRKAITAKQLRKFLKPYKNRYVYIQKAGWANIYSLEEAETNRGIDEDYIYLRWSGDSDLWSKGCDYARGRILSIKQDYDKATNKLDLDSDSAEAKLLKNIDYELDHLKQIYTTAETDTKEKIRQALNSFDNKKNKITETKLIAMIREIVK